MSDIFAILAYFPKNKGENLLKIMQFIQNKYRFIPDTKFDKKRKLCIIGLTTAKEATPCVTGIKRLFYGGAYLQ